MMVVGECIRTRLGGWRGVVIGKVPGAVLVLWASGIKTVVPSIFVEPDND